MSASQLRWMVAGLAVTVLAGCSLLPAKPADGPPITVPSVVTSGQPTVVPSDPVTTPAPGPDPTLTIPPFPNETPSVPTTAPTKKGLQVGSSRIRGRAGSASWDIALPAFSGAAVAKEANRRVRAAANDLVAQVKREAKGDGGTKRTLSGDGTVVTNDGRTVQVVIMFTDYLAGTAHPALYVTTTVVDVKRSQPVLLTQVVQNPPEGLRFLRTQVIATANKKGDPIEPAGLAPKISNWANWQSTRTGMRFYFNDYQLGPHGIVAYTIPWKKARLVLSAYGEKLLVP